MGLFDRVTSAMNRGTESAGRAAEKVKINSKLNELNKHRQQLAAQLGASLYLATKDDAELREGREALYDGIASCDAEREQLQARIAQLDSMSEAAETFNCAVCGAKMSGGDLFCSGCGTPAEKARAAAAPAAQSTAATVFCGSCGALMAADDAFCMSCGTKVGEVAAVVVDGSDALIKEETEIELIEVRKESALDAGSSQAEEDIAAPDAEGDE